MKYFDWDEQKNAKLLAERDICFEDILTAIAEGRVLQNINHPNKARYPNQKVLIVQVNDYAYIVPYIQDDTMIFLKTIYPSRQMTRKYLAERRQQ